MRLILLAALGVVTVGCGSPEGPAQRLNGTWIYIAADNSVAVGATFSPDGTYVLQEMSLTSTNSADDEIETGTFSATDSDITTVPQQYSCPGPDPATTVAYDFSGSSLQIVSSSGITTLGRDTAQPSSMFSLTLGCFQSDGSFVAQPLAPVAQ